MIAAARDAEAAPLEVEQQLPGAGAGAVQGLAVVDRGRAVIAARLAVLAQAHQVQVVLARHQGRQDQGRQDSQHHA